MWKALINDDGSPANKTRDNEMFYEVGKKIAFLWKDAKIRVRFFDRSPAPISRPGQFESRKPFIELTVETWEDAAKFACSSLGVDYLPLPDFWLALTEARRELAAQKQADQEALKVRRAKKAAFDAAETVATGAIADVIPILRVAADG